MKLLKLKFRDMPPGSLNVEFIDFNLANQNTINIDSRFLNYV